MRADASNTESMSEFELNFWGSSNTLEIYEKKKKRSLVPRPAVNTLCISSENSHNFQQEVSEMEPGIQIFYIVCPP